MSKQIDIHARKSASLEAMGLCPADCPGCAHRYLDYDASCAQKMRWLQSSLAYWCEHLQTLQTPAPARRLAYRGKAMLHARFVNECWQFGLLKRDKALVSIPDCPVQTESINNLLRYLATNLPDERLFPLNMVSIAERQLVLILKSRFESAFETLVESLVGRVRELGFEGLWIHCNPSTGKRIFSKHSWHLIWGQQRSRNPHGLLYGPAAFSQLLPELHRESLLRAAEFMSVLPGDRVIDLYCGIGTSMAHWLSLGAQVIGIESSREAVACAAANVPQAECLTGYCEARLPQIDQWLCLHPTAGRDHLYVNPPRTGLEPDVLQWIASKFRPATIAYLSCSAGTLGRDLHVLEAQGYCLDSLIPYDFFPHTRHVEVLALLRKR